MSDMRTTRTERLDAEDFHEQPLVLCGKSFVAQHSGALYWPAEDALIIAGLPLGPGHETRAALARLASALDATPATGVIVLGPILSEPSGSDLAGLRILQEGRDWIWITGARGQSADADLGGHSADAVTIAGITLRHTPSAGRVTHEIAGGLNPVARVMRPGHSFRRPCFASTGQRLILPAFALAGGGLNILDPACEPLFGHDGLKVWLIGHEGIYPVAARLLRED